MALEVISLGTDPTGDGGDTSALQTQLDAKQAVVAGAIAFYKSDSDNLFLLAFNKTPATTEIVGQAWFQPV